MTIAQVFNQSSAEIKNKIIAGIMLKGISYSTAYMWCVGGRAPKSYARPFVVEIVNRETGGTHTEKELWPDA